MLRDQDTVAALAVAQHWAEMEQSMAGEWAEQQWSELKHWVVQETGRPGKIINTTAG